MIYAFVIMIIAGYIINELSYKYSLKNLIIKRKISKNIVEIDEEFDITVTFENNKFYPVTFIQTAEQYPSVIYYKKGRHLRNKDNVYNTISLFIMPYQRVKRTYKVSANKRGRYLIGDITVNVGDFLGLKEYTVQIPCSEELVVLPRRYDLDENMAAAGDYNGDISVRRWIIEDPVLMTGIKEYTGCEPLKTIHWPSSLRYGKLMVKKFDYTTDEKVLIIMNIECCIPFWINIDCTKIEKCISAARSMMEYFEEEGIPYGFASNSQISGMYNESSVITPGLGGYHLSSLLEVLGRCDYSINMTFEDYLKKLLSINLKYSTCVVITPEVFDSYVEYMNMISEQCEKFVLITFEDKNLNNLKDGIEIMVERGK